MRIHLFHYACFAGLLGVCMISGCGQQGPLYLPEDGSESNPLQQKEEDDSKPKQAPEAVPESIETR